jgi:WXXGXW repeat (2 copies)
MMHWKRLVGSIVLCGGLVFASACVAGFVVRVPPPAMRIEVRGVAPAPAYVWVDGHWAWEGSWVWISGRWARPPAGRRAWERGRWEHRRRGWIWIEGRWR